MVLILIEQVQKIMMEEDVTVQGLRRVVEGVLQCYARNWVDLERVFQFQY